ncbi:cytidylyltransferase [Emydomyces testavorans]|uniref:Cytidylyltransferase n=1 Tax=Emydomyces testavorans TaxID=2070801 RepID=A0AAF0IEW5_9EURO|nr:cytidylyltransferase [Emydomyces testavorans]
MSGTTTPTNPHQHLRQRYQVALHEFTASQKTFEVFDTISPPDTTCSKPAILYVLDSSFNPPTRAHLHIAKSAILDSHHSDLSTIRLLLLLSTQNADKPSKPAPFEDRLAMMNQFAQDVQDDIVCDTPSATDFNNHIPAQAIPPVDICVTKLPYFVDKAAAISSSGAYPADLEQVHLTGYDTLVRIFDPKYYPPEHTLAPLAPFLEKHRLRVTLRPDDAWGDGKEQGRFVANLARGMMEKIGGRREWAGRIELAEEVKKDEEVISSTKARQEAREGNKDALELLLSYRVLKWVVAEGLYRT